LLLVFSLPTRSASQRVEIWRKLQRYGVLSLPSSGYLLPNLPLNQERMEWLASAIRTYKGQASVVQVHSFDELSDGRLKELFLEARASDFQKLLQEGRRLLALPPARRPPAGLKRIRRRFQELQEIDFFSHPAREKVDKMLGQFDTQAGPGKRSMKKSAQYLNRVWITRSRPGIDRVSSAWFIRRFVDPKARFVFGSEPGKHPEAIPFDMFTGEGFGHRGEDCTFETLVREFAIRDSRVRKIAQIIHDADLDDEKFGRMEGYGLDKVLKGWARQELPDDDLLQRGINLIEGLYESLA
jgi:hypothetical protein